MSNGTILLSALALLGPGLALPDSSAAQEPTSDSLEHWIRSGYAFSWESGEPMSDDVREVWRELGRGGTGYGFRTFGIREANSGEFQGFAATMEYWRVTLDELHTSVVEDVGLAWGVHTEEFKIEGQPPETLRVRFTNTLRWNGQRWEGLLYHRDAQWFGENGWYRQARQ